MIGNRLSELIERVVTDATYGVLPYTRLDVYRYEKAQHPCG
ncbi:MAG TPA: hypothetical protein VK404_12755 [Spirosoma sp.]|nr:hypothetical protein [Spirosoma sp.]